MLSQDKEKKVQIIRWIIGGLFAMIVLVNGFHFSSIFIAISAFLMFPLPFVKAFLSEKNIKSSVAIVLSIMFMFVGTLTSPLAKGHDDKAQVETTTESEIESSNSTNKSNSESEVSSISSEKETSISSEKETSISSEKETGNESMSEIEVLVWVTSSGSKYHSYSGCSNMKNSIQMDQEEAERAGYEPCKKCW